MKQIGLIVPTKRLTRARQEHLMREYDIDEMVENAGDAIQLVRNGRALVVAQCSVLGRKSEVIKEVARQVHERGGYIIEAATGRKSNNTADAFEMGVDTNKRAPLTKAKAKAMATKYEDADPRLIKAKKLMARRNPRLSNAEIAKRVGIDATTLWRRLGKRGLKAGRIPAKKTKR